MRLTSAINSIRNIDVRGETFISLSAFLVMGVLRFGSSLILTRWLSPEAYGVVAIAASLLFIFEMLSDLGITGQIVRSARGDEPRFLSTLWTIKLVRGLFNAALVFLLAPAIAGFYGNLDLIWPIRLIGLVFILMGLESTSLAYLIRTQNSRYVTLIELSATVAVTLFTVAATYFFRSYWAILWGMVLHRGLIAVISHVLSPNGFRARLAFDKSAAMELLGFSKHVAPTSLMTMSLIQFERVALARLFDLKIVGSYGVAVNIYGMAIDLIVKLSHNILYPRFSKFHREQGAVTSRDYHKTSVKLFAAVLFIPGFLCGISGSLISVLYDSRYVIAGFALACLMVRALFQALQLSSEAMLNASGQTSVQLYSSLIRLIWVVGLGTAGYHFAGFEGLLILCCLDGLPSMIYVWRRLNSAGLLDLRVEAMKLGWIFVCILAGWLSGQVLLSVFGKS